MISLPRTYGVAILAVPEFSVIVLFKCEVIKKPRWFIVS